MQEENILEEQNEKLLLATENGDLEGVKEALDSGADIDAKNEDSKTPLMLASDKSNIEIVKMLLERGADTNIKVDNGAGIEDIPNSLEDGVEKFLENLEKNKSHENNGKTALHFASKRTMNKNLFVSPDKAFEEVLQEAVEEGKITEESKNEMLFEEEQRHQNKKKIVQLLLDNGADIEAKTNKEKTSLLIASKRGDIEMSQLLLDNGANIEAKDNKGKTSLMLASDEGDKEIVQLLLENGADTNIKVDNGADVIDETDYLKGFEEAQKAGNEELNLFLAKNKAQKENGRTALHFASDTLTKQQALEIILDKKRAENKETKDASNNIWVLGTEKKHQNKKEIVQLLLESGADIEVKTDKGETALFLTSKRGDIEMSQLLLDNGADIETTNNKGINLLMFASANGDNEIIQLLLESGADIEATNDKGITPLMFASGNGHNETVKLLLKNGADIEATNDKGATPLILAGGNGDKEIVQLLLERGADIEATNYKGATPIMFASEKEDKEIVQLLLDNGANIEANSDGGITALMLASGDGNNEIVQLLLDNGANIEAKAKGGVTPLMFTLHNGDKKTVQLLLDNGANIEAKANEGINPLMFASEKGEKEIIQLLLDNGANIEATNDKGATPLMFASMKGEKETVQLLLDRGANIEANANGGITVLMFTSMKGEKETVQLLLNRGANIEANANGGITALMFASGDGDNEMVKLLLDNGADIETKNIEGDNALIVASNEGRKETVQLLLDRGAVIEAKAKSGISLFVSEWAFYTKNKILKIILNQLVKIFEYKENSGNTALMEATSEGQKSVIKLLIDNGATVPKSKLFREKKKSYLHPKIQVMIDKILGYFSNLVFKGIPLGYDLKKEEMDNYFQQIDNLSEFIISYSYDKKQQKTMSNPQKLVKLLTNFTIDTPIKYTVHEWRNRIDDKYFNDFDLFLTDVNKQFEGLGSALKALSPKLYQKSEHFIVSTENPQSWQSMQGLKAWVEEKKEPFEFPIEKKSILFKEIIEKFKNEIELRGNRLQEIFLAQKKRLGRKFKITISDNLKSEKFYTDVETFTYAIDEIFAEIEKYANEQENYSVDVELFKPQNDFIELHIIHIGSTSNRQASELLERIKKSKGDSVLRGYFENLCDWEIEASYRDTNFKIDCFSEEITNIQKPKGFTHIMRFYK